MMFAKIAKARDIKPGQNKVIEAGGRSVAIFNVDGSFYAIDEICPHKGGPLAGGCAEALTVRCPWHGAVFSLQTGDGIAGPCGTGVRRFETRVQGDDLEVDVGDG